MTAQALKASHAFYPPTRNDKGDIILASQPVPYVVIPKQEAA